jgi:hypothetical protein
VSDLAEGPHRQNNIDTRMIPLDNVRTKLATIWLVGVLLILSIVIVQSLFGHFGNDIQGVWEWLLPAVMPTVGMIISSIGATALIHISTESVVRRSFARTAEILSIFYLLLVLFTIVIQPKVAPNDISGSLQLFHTSNLWLGPLQGIVASSLGVLFASKESKVS